MNRQLTPISQPVVELPVTDVEQSQAYYRDHLGFEVSWTWDYRSFGSVVRGETAIFLSRREQSIQPVSIWIFAPEIDATLHELQAFGANVAEPLEAKPWGLRQFTVVDPDGHRLNFHHET